MNMKSSVLALTLISGLLDAPLLDAQVPTAPTTNAPGAVKPKLPRNRFKWDLMDLGPFFSSHMEAPVRVNKSVAINLGGGTVCFDTEMLKVADAWTDGFVLLPTGRDGLEGMPKPDSTNIVFTNPGGAGWADADGNFSDKRPAFKNKPYGPLPREHAKWKGIYLNGGQTILSYSVGKAGVLESHSFNAEAKVFMRRLEVTPAGAPLTAVVCGAGKSPDRKVEPNFITITNGERMLVIALNGLGALDIVSNTVVLKLDGKTGGNSMLQIWSGTAAEFENFKTVSTIRFKAASLESLTKGGPARWGAPLSVPGKLSADTNGAYVYDTISVPENNPYNSWIRCSGVDFFTDGKTAAICSVSGDVWLVRNIDDTLEKVTWQRFATGLFQPLGLKIVDDLVYVLGRDQITRLHDLNKDGEADFYENFNNDVGAFMAYHEFAHDLHVDSHGDFYFAKGGDLGEAQHPHHGSIIKVSKDGSKLSVVANGLRAPNGMGMGPNDEISVSDNEGNWVPSSRFSIIKPGGFYGHVQTAQRTPKPVTYDNPVCWMPKNVDNSSGGQVWVKGGKWGPFKDEMLFMSYGHCTLFKVLLDQVDGEYQGGVVKFPFKFDSGVMRARFNDKDGQLYLCGLSVWQSDGPKKGGFYRVRYTGKPVNMPTGLHVTDKGVKITFTGALDPATANDMQNYNLEQWNYKWTGNYGSPEFSVAEPEKKGHDKVAIASAKLSADGKSVFLEIPGIKPVMQMKIGINVKATDGSPVKHEIHNSIYKLAKE